MQGVAAKNDASYDLSSARASVTGQTTIAASTATTSLPNGRIVTRGCPAPTPECEASCREPAKLGSPRHSPGPSRGGRGDCEMGQHTRPSVACHLTSA